MLSRAWTKRSSRERRVCASSQGPLDCREEPGLGSWGREGPTGLGWTGTLPGTSACGQISDLL